MDRLDEVCGLEWSVAYTPWADKLICNLTIAGTTRSSTGGTGQESERGEIADGTRRKHSSGLVPCSGWVGTCNSLLAGVG